MKRIFLPVLVLFLTTSLFAQSQIILQNNSRMLFFTDLSEAFDEMDDNDTIYITGGSYNIGNGAVIDKKVAVYGAGHHPDSSRATLPTIITGVLSIVTGADSSSISGIYFNSKVQFGNTSGTQTAKHVTLTRCNFAELVIGYTTSSNLVESITLRENIFRGSVTGLNRPNLVFEKNVFAGQVNSFALGGVFRNNVFLSTADLGASSGYSWIGCILQNNIMCEEWEGTSSTVYIRQSTFSNNLMVGDGWVDYLASWDNVDNNNVIDEDIDSLFVKYDDDIFDYAHDYHLAESSKGLNKGTDGTDPGIYGTMEPHSPVPGIPYVRHIYISPNTNAEGKLEVEVEVIAPAY